MEYTMLLRRYTNTWMLSDALHAYGLRAFHFRVCFSTDQARKKVRFS